MKQLLVVGSVGSISNHSSQCTDFFAERSMHGDGSFGGSWCRERTFKADK